MRPFRLACTVFGLFLIVFSLLLSLFQPVPDENGDPRGHKRAEFRSRWSFGAPASLFPPSAIISLTDDNTTFFLARPALYGALLPDDGLTGQLWVGSGFTDDVYIRVGMKNPGPAEFGCSDIPGWTAEGVRMPIPSQDSGSNPIPPAKGNDDGRDQTLSPGSKSQKDTPAENDNTDNFLHYPLLGPPILKSTGQDFTDTTSTHADIQSLQESVAISGKVVLLSRGGCGFLEKTKWVQRRGGAALIVGDYTRGGYLIQMSANEDASNITIPSVFTAYTSAHLLSSLLPPRLRAHDSGSTRNKKGQKDNSSKLVLDTATARAAGPAATPTPGTAIRKEANQQNGETNYDWLSSIVRRLGLAKGNTDHKNSRRPPNSGTISWIQSQDWNDEITAKPDAKRPIASSNRKADVADPKSGTSDDFVIGVHDWRDPDMLGQTKSSNRLQTAGDRSDSVTQTGSANGYFGRSRAPESGVYGPSKPDSKLQTFSKMETKPSNSEDLNKDKGWLHNLLRSSHLDNTAKENRKAQDMYKNEIATHYVQDQDFEDEKQKDTNEHDGLWITIIPASVSTSPFFDTLLVLVVSPLVTLSIVYALLLLRSRIRRRRWRAPRSVVDRLPVRTYHTMSYSSSSSTSRADSPHAPSAATPLLPTTIIRPRNRSATISEIGHDASRSIERARAQLSSREKNSPNNTFKRKYQGRQVECVVCLEEYIDGQSQVMSLPCGHEFHAECM